MMAMMLPSAAPAILAFGAMTAKWRGKGAKTAPLAVFAAAGKPPQIDYIPMPPALRAW